MFLPPLLEGWLFECEAMAACVADNLGRVIRVIIHFECTNFVEASQTKNADQDTNSGLLLSHPSGLTPVANPGELGGMVLFRLERQERAAVRTSGSLRPPRFQSSTFTGEEAICPKAEAVVGPALRFRSPKSQPHAAQRGCPFLIIRKSPGPQVEFEQVERA